MSDKLVICPLCNSETTTQFDVDKFCFSHVGSIAGKIKSKKKSKSSKENGKLGGRPRNSKINKGGENV